jgi:hypothetical protein
MAVANALGQRGSKCVTAVPWKSPMMAWSTVCDDYFRVADIREPSRPATSERDVLLRRPVRLARHPLAGRNNAISVRLVRHMAL